MIRRLVEREVTQAVEVSEQRLRRVCREEAGRAIKACTPALEGALHHHAGGGHRRRRGRGGARRDPA